MFFVNVFKFSKFYNLQIKQKTYVKKTQPNSQSVLFLKV